MKNFIDRIYYISPPFIQSIGVSLYGLYWKQRRYGGDFKKYVASFKHREGLSLDDWKAYQETRLRQLLLYANEYIPYYRDLFVKLGIEQYDLEVFKLSDLRKLPVLSKEIFRDLQENFLSNNLNEKPATYMTSGTTGTPLAIKFTREGDRLAQAAYETRVRNWAGVDYKMSRGMVGGRMVVPKANAEPPFWRYNIFERQLYMSAFHISPANTPNYARALNHYKPDYLVGYASSHYFLARMLDEQGISMYQPKAVLTSSEKLSDDMRDMIEKVYGCEVFDAYSGVEACCQASECEYHNMHISPDMGIIEFLNDENQPVPLGVPGRIVATGLLNFAQPLIRYDTGDIAVLSEESCPCG
ncbi:MAG: phenylacetate--CoA ligase family protein, partial [Candidatus Helarchaeota archaeon]